MQRGITIAAAVLFAACTPSSVLADQTVFVSLPVPPEYDLVAAWGTKAECVTEPAVLNQMNGHKLQFGGKTILLSGPTGRDFADQWRAVLEIPPVRVKHVLAHMFYFPSDVTGQIVDTFEFGADGCAISHAKLFGSAWNVILHRVEEYQKQESVVKTKDT